jgi:FixJ family two-component response regulator
LAADGAGLPIIFLTGKGDIPMTAKGMKRGAVDFLTKPVDERELLEAVQSAIAKDNISWLALRDVAEINLRLATLI